MVFRRSGVSKFDHLFNHPIIQDLADLAGIYILAPFSDRVFVPLFDIISSLLVLQHSGQIFFYTAKGFKNLQGTVYPFPFSNICREIFGVCQDPRLTQKVYSADDFSFLHPQVVSYIVHPGPGVLVPGPAAASAGNELPYNPDSCFLFLLIYKQRRSIYFSDGFLGIPAQYTVCKNPWHVLPPPDISRFFQGGNGCFHPHFYLFNAFVPTCLPGNFQGRLGNCPAQAGYILNDLPDLLNFFNVDFRLI
ncbi:MAG: hypothetical protein BWY80_00182 [Firmicutes bacterium ADurb.Bin456]|nr:MAG: hypothetical protein BWY80_00182 [Firmicutes bacterium ADurb.Bin456]